MLKKANYLQKIQVLMDISYGYKRKFLSVFLLSLISTVAISFGISFISPILNLMLKKDITNDDSFNSKLTKFLLEVFPENTTQYLIVVFIIIISLMSVVILYTNWRKSYLINEVTNKWRTQIFTNYMNSKFAFYSAQKQGNMYYNSISLPRDSSQMLRVMIEFGIGIINGACYFIFLILISWEISLFMVLIGFLLAALPLKIINKKTKSYGRERIGVSQELSQNCGQALSGFRQILLYNQVEEEAKLFNKISWDESILNIKTAVLRTAPRSVRDFLLFLMIAIALGGVYLLKLDLTTYIPIMAAYSVIAMKLLPLISEIMSNIITLAEKSPSVKLLHSLLTESAELRKSDKEGHTFEGLEKDIIIKNLSFSYEEGKNILSNVNFTIPKGKMTAIIGPSGSGKSTIVDLLVGLYSHYQGEILINGNELRSYSTNSLWNNISYVSQDPFIFNRTIRENITLNIDNVNEENINRAIDISGCREFIDKLEHGIDTLIGERGTRLSGGQRQRISIARAVLRDPDIYIFDEATSALDTETEKFIQKSIEEISKTSTVIVIAHRLSTIENADLVIDMEEL